MRGWMLAALLASLAFAGCMDDGGPTDDPEDDPIAMAETLDHWTIISASESGPEPSLGVTPDGILFTVLSPNVFRSSDDGVTWEDLGDPASTFPNNDPDLAVDVDGTVWESRLYALACNEVSVSRDLGETWSTNPVACTGPVGDRQYVIPTEGGEAYVYWHDLPTFQQTVMKTTDYGTTWIPQGSAEGLGNVFLATGSSGWGGGGFWNEATGSVFFTYSFNSGALDPASRPSGPGFSVTRDGQTWQSGVASAYDGTTLGLALVTGAADDAGNIYLTWGESYDGDVAIYVAGSQDDGVTWTDKIRIDPATTSKVFPVVMAGAEGRMAVAYYEAYEQAHPDDVEGNWTVNMTWTPDFFADDPEFRKVAMSTQDVKTGPICISGTTCTGNREFADYFDGVRLPDGRVALTYNLLEDGDGALRNVYAVTGGDVLGARPE